ncbi:RNA polymerase sigma factor [Streptomyces sp. P5-A9]|uniref:RNA polymerase sigma factor n=1 Tax=Streptomyces sp. P5-A9 TaxID=3071730 RepID=UPI003FCD8D79
MRNSDNDLRRRVREGDREAFAQLYEAFARAVYHHGLRLTGDWSTAEDIMSETFLAAWANRATVHEEGAPCRGCWASPPTRRTTHGAACADGSCS